MSADPLRTRILIIGAGPAGLTLSLALSRYGVDHILLERFPCTAHTPRAHITNQRTMEIFRDLGIEKEVEQVAAPAELMGSNAWVTTMAGPEVLRSEAWGAGEHHSARYRLASPCSMLNCSQHVMEPVLARKIEDLQVGDIRFGHDYLSCEQDGGGVTATAREVASGRVYKIRADYMIGADGARSLVADQIGLPFDGEMGAEGGTGIGLVVYVWIKANLVRYCAHRPGTMYWLTDFSEGVVFTLVSPWDEWVAGWNLPPGVEFERSDESIRNRISAAIGDPSVEIEIKNVSTWKLNRMWAKRLQAGRVFCIGDAIHRHPPMNGLGSNTSVADAYNLAWKLKFVLDGKAGPTLLESYDSERQPIAERIVSRAWNSMGSFFGRFYGEILGYAPNSPKEDVKRALEVFLQDCAEREERLEAFETFKVEVLDQAFNALGIELGYRYGNGVRMSDGTPEPVIDGHPDVAYQPTTWPGARLPHVWLERGHQRISSLDLVGKGRFTLLITSSDTRWVDAWAEAEGLAGVAITLCTIGTANAAVRDPLRHWARVRGVGPDGAVLVRPDGHVAWRAHSIKDAAALPRVMMELLGRTAGAPCEEARELPQPVDAY